MGIPNERTAVCGQNSGVGSQQLLATTVLRTDQWHTYKTTTSKTKIQE
jgi:hypothetical protein